MDVWPTASEGCAQSVGGGGRNLLLALPEVPGSLRPRLRRDQLSHAMTDQRRSRAQGLLKVCFAGKLAPHGGQVTRDLITASAPAGLVTMLQDASSHRVRVSSVQRCIGRRSIPMAPSWLRLVPAPAHGMQYATLHRGPEFGAWWSRWHLLAIPDALRHQDQTLLLRLLPCLQARSAPALQTGCDRSAQ